MGTKKLVLFITILLISIGNLFSFGLALGAEAFYSPSVLIIGDSSSFLSDITIYLFTSIHSENLIYTISIGMEKGKEHYSFHRFSKLSETASLSTHTSIGYLFNQSTSLNLSTGLKLTSIGSIPYNTRVLSPYVRLTYRKEFLVKDDAPDFSLIIPLEVIYGKTSKGISLGFGLGYSFSNYRTNNK